MRARELMRCAAVGLLVAFAAVDTVNAATVSGPAATADPVKAAPMPPLFFAGTVAGDEFLTRIKANPRFAQLSRDVIGSPIRLQISKSYRTSAGGVATGLASAILAGSSLGLLPMVTNGDLTITYEVMVNGTLLTSYSYQKNFTRMQSIYGTDKTYGMGTDGFEWAKSTVDSFLADSAKDAKIDALVVEYQFYFGGGH